MEATSIDFVCPICKEKIKNCDIKSHCDLEFERLIENSNNIPTESTSQESKVKIVKDSKEDSQSKLLENNKPSASGSHQNPNTFSIFQKVKNNRQSRVKASSRKRPPSSNEPLCPVCNTRPSENINIHVEKCLKNSIQGSDDESIDIEGESHDEFEWSGNKRIRWSYSCGESALQNAASMEEDEELNVDGDDSIIYGPSQYQDSDIISPPQYAQRNNVGLTSTESSSGGSEEDEEYLSDFNNTSDRESIQIQSNKSTDTIINSLKSRIRDLEKNSKNKIKCLICLEDPKDPAVSVCCWHVHCEMCWLRTLGSRKLCPQCNLITTPTDLRRIYM